MKVLVFDTETSGLPTRRGYDKYYLIYRIEIIMTHVE